MAGIRAVVFDMDGVIIDSEPIWHDVELDVFARHGTRLSSEEKWTTMGWRLNEVVAHWLPDHSPEERLAVEDELIDGVVARISGEEPLPGVIEALELFASQSIPIAIASSSYYRLIEAVTDRFGITGYFAAIHSAQDEVKGKPDPAVYLSAARKLGVDPDQCVAIEDSANGARSAQAAGMKVIGVPPAELADDPIFETVELQLESLADLDEQLWSQLQGLD